MIHRSTILPTLLVSLIGSVVLSTATVEAAVCNVPSQFPSLQDATRNSNCTVVNVAAGIYAEAIYIQHSLTLNGAGSDVTHITGNVRIWGDGVDVTINGVDIDTTGPLAAGCFRHALEVIDGANARVNQSRVINKTSQNPCFFGYIFADGFQTGSTNQWDAASGERGPAETTTAPETKPAEGFPKPSPEGEATTAVEPALPTPANGNGLRSSLPLRNDDP